MNAAAMMFHTAYYVNLLAIMLAIRSAEWIQATVMLPWIMVLLCKATRTQLVHTARSHCALLVISATLSLLILMGCQQHVCVNHGLEQAPIPLLWLPITALAKSMDSEHHKIGMLATLSIATSIISILVIWQSLMEGHERPPGLSHNVLTPPMILMMLCLLGALTEMHKRKKIKWVFGAIAAAVVLACILSRSRAAFFIFIIAGAMYITHKPQERTKIILCMAPIVAIWILSLSQRINTIAIDIDKYQQNQYRTSIGERSDAIRWSISHSLDNPIFGKGPEKVASEFHLRWEKWNRPEDLSIPMLHLHNDYFQMALSYGIPAAILYAAMWMHLMIKFIKTTLPPTHTPNTQALNAWIQALIGIILTTGLIDSLTYWPNSWAMTITSLGLALSLLPDAGKHHMSS